ncbi:MAG: DUF4140 domain-containing protein [Bacteroidota bacterium]|nr:DUF4140 domain-containing protein [Bacteroidota bacterium]
MKTKSFLLVFILLINICFAENKKEIESKIEKVTVYLHGAQVTRTAELALEKGQQTLVFTRNTAELAANSIQVSCENPDVKILSVSHKFDYLENKHVIKETEQIYNHMQNNRLLIQKFKSMVDVYKQEKELLLTNKNIGGDDGVNITELKTAADYYRERITDYQESQFIGSNVIKKIGWKISVRNNKNEEIELGVLE